MYRIHARLRNLETAVAKLPRSQSASASVPWNHYTIKKIGTLNVHLTSIDRKRYFRSDNGNNLSVSDVHQREDIKKQIAALYKSMEFVGGYGMSAFEDFDRILALQWRLHDRRCETLTAVEKDELEQLIRRRYWLHETTPEAAAQARYDELNLRQLDREPQLSENERDEMRRLHSILNKKGDIVLVNPYEKWAQKAAPAGDIEHLISKSILVAHSPGQNRAGRTLSRNGFTDVDYATEALAVLDRLSLHSYDLVIVDVALHVPYEGALLPILEKRFPALPIIEVNCEPGRTSSKLRLPKSFTSKELLSALREAFDSSPPG